MADTPTGGELARELFRLSKKVDDSLEYAFAMAKVYAKDDDAYRMARAKLQLVSERELKASGHPDPKVADKEAWVDLHTSEERKAAHESEALMIVSREAVKARRAQLSALQSVANIIRAEADLARTGPDL